MTHLPERLVVRLVVRAACAAAVLLAALAGAVAAQPPSPAVDTAATKASLLAADRELARRSAADGPAVVLDAMEPDAAVLFWGQPTILRGPAEARGPFLERYGAPSSYAWRPVHAIASADGRFGCTVGFSRFEHAADTARRVRRGAYATCWRREGDGAWRIVGHQRRDSPPRDLVDSDTAALEGAPHSPTVAIGADPLAEVLAVDVDFAAMAATPAGPGPAFASFAAPDGILLGIAGLPRGRERILETFRGFANAALVLWVPVRSFGAASGGLGFTVGYSATTPQAGKPGPKSYGKFFTIWRQEPDGRWRYVIDIGSPRP